MLATSKNVPFPGHNHLLTNGTDDPTLWVLPERQYRWVAGGYDVEIGHFRSGYLVDRAFFWRCVIATCPFHNNSISSAAQRSYHLLHEQVYGCGIVVALTLTLLGPSAGVSGSLDSYCSLKPLCSGMGEVVPARTSPTLLPPSPRTVLSLSCFKVLQCINCRD